MIPGERLWESAGRLEGQCVMVENEGNFHEEYEVICHDHHVYVDLAWLHKVNHLVDSYVGPKVRKHLPNLPREL